MASIASFSTAKCKGVLPRLSCLFISLNLNYMLHDLLYDFQINLCYLSMGALPSLLT